MQFYPVRPGDTPSRWIVKTELQLTSWNSSGVLYPSGAIYWATGWLQHSSFNEKQHQLAMDLGRHLARLTINSNTCLYSQWLPGAKNDVSDILYRTMII